MKFALVVTGALASKQVAKEDDVVMLSLAAMRESLNVEDSLTEVSRAKNPREASELLQQYAFSALDSGSGVDDDTKQKLIAIRDLLTNETYLALEQAHRHDQDLLDKHARAINDCGEKHVRHLQLDVDGQEVKLVRDTENVMYECYGFDDHSSGLLQKPERYWKDWSGINLPDGFMSCKDARNEMLKNCDDLDNFIKNIPTLNCDVPRSSKKMDDPSCGEDSPEGVDSDLHDWLTNMNETAHFYHDTWKVKYELCNNSRALVDANCETCNEKQRIYEQAFCSYRQGLHATCREYQGCYVMNEEEYNDLVEKVLYNADSRKIDWKAIHKIECYINVLISQDKNEVRAKDLLNCEAGNLNTIASILTGFNETNYLSMIQPDINVSCWDLDVPRYIDFKECDMSSVTQHPCTEKWNERYEGLYSADTCTECAPIPDDFQYTLEQEKENDRATSDDFGGGWYFVNELHKSKTDINDLTALAAGGYHLPKYATGNLRWNEVLIQRVSANWCDSWGSQSDFWVEKTGASMCIQSDSEHVYCMNNAGGNHSWRRQPVSHFGGLCGDGSDGRPECECWPGTARGLSAQRQAAADNKWPACFDYTKDADGPTAENVPAPKHVRIMSMKSDGSVVKVSFQGEEKTGILRVGNYNSFLQNAEGCRAIESVQYRVYVRCMGCATIKTEFHTKDGARFNGGMRIGHMGKATFSAYTYEAWFKSPLEGRLPREIFGGATTGFTLLNDASVPCMHNVGAGIVAGGKKERGYQIHAGSTKEYGSVCFDENTWYHVAVTRDGSEVKVYVNGKDVTEVPEHPLSSTVGDSKLSSSFGAGFGDGGQLFNVRIWDHARKPHELIQEAFVSSPDSISDTAGLKHWWPLVDATTDVMTNSPLTGPEVQYAPIWCSELEKSGMRGC